MKPRAVFEVQEVFDWYEEQREGLGEQFRQEFEKSLGQLETNPFISNLIYKGSRRLMLRKFPYKIFFKIERDIVKVLTVIHASQSDRIWKRRVRNDK